MLLHPSTYTIETNDLAVAEGYTLGVTVDGDTTTLHLTLAMPIGYCNQIFYHDYVTSDLLYTFSTDDSDNVELELLRDLPTSSYDVALVTMQWAGLINAIAQAS